MSARIEVLRRAFVLPAVKIEVHRRMHSGNYRWWGLKPGVDALEDFLIRFPNAWAAKYVACFDREKVKAAGEEEMAIIFRLREDGWDGPVKYKTKYAAFTLKAASGWERVAQ